MASPTGPKVHSTSLHKPAEAARPRSQSRFQPDLDAIAGSHKDFLQKLRDKSWKDKPSPSLDATVTFDTSSASKSVSETARPKFMIDEEKVSVA